MSRIPQGKSAGYELLVKPFANPTVGTDFSLTVPADRWWKLVSGHLTLATSGTVANRNFTCNANVAGVEYWVDGASLDIPASKGIEIGLAQGRPAGGAVVPLSTGIIADVLFVGLPNFWLPPGWVFKTGTSGLQAGDQYSLCEFLIAELPGAPANAPPLHP